VARWLTDIPLRPKIALIAGGLTVASLLAFGAIYASLQARQAWQDANARVVAETRAAAEAIATRPRSRVTIEHALDALHNDSAVRAVLVRDAAHSPAAANEPGKGSDGAGAHRDGWLRQLAMTEVEAPLTTGKGTVGTLHVEADLSGDIDAAVSGCRGFLLGCSAIAVLLATAMVWLLEGQLRKPLLGLIEDLRTMRASGDFSRRPPRLRHDEFGTLLEEINALLGEHEGSERSLRAYKTEFERRVLDRTRQLDQAVAEAREATKRAEEASRAKGDFLAHMSHEIRTPLNGVLGMAELLQHSPTLDERQRRYAVVIHQSGKALLQLINDILDFSKIEAGKLELTKERFCIRQMVEDALEILAERAQSKGLELICDIPLELDTMVYGDALRLRQIIINLVSNAVKFTETGDVTVSVKVEPGIETALFGFEIADTGIGIDAANCAAIFDAFVQADASTSRRYGGTGLGLAISKQLVELMGGTIGVRSTLGMGSTFHFSLPLAVDRTAKRAKVSSMLATTRVLIVEKNDAARRILKQHLTSWGAVVAELSSAEDALERLRHALSGEFEALLIDARLPGTTPSETVAAVRDIAEFADTPILMMHTGSGEPPPESRDMKGPLAWQSKPIRRSQLQSTLEHLVGRSQRKVTEPRRTAAGAAGSSAALPGSRPRRVLLVEDNPVNREVARAMLQTLEVQVHTACNGKEALEKLAGARYDAVLMDCQMPDIDGYETTRRYREWELLQGRSRTPVVALTANALRGDAEKCLAAGMDHYVSKPFTIEQLHTVLETCGHAPTEGSAEPAAEVLDAKTLSRIQDLSAGGSSDLFARLAGLYEVSSSELVATLHRAAASDDLAAMSRAAHALKSSSANVGATTLTATCGEVERAARESRTEAAKGLVKRLIGEHREVLRALKRRRSDSGTADGRPPVLTHNGAQM